MLVGVGFFQSQAAMLRCSSTGGAGTMIWASWRPGRCLIVEPVYRLSSAPLDSRMLEKPAEIFDRSAIYRPDTMQGLLEVHLALVPPYRAAAGFAAFADQQVTGQDRVAVALVIRRSASP